MPVGAGIRLVRRCSTPPSICLWPASRSWFQPDKTDLPRDYVWSRAEVSDELREISLNDLSHVSACQLAGDRWVRDSGQLAIRVPSVVIPEEFNVLLNPTHADDKRRAVGCTTTVSF